MPLFFLRLFLAALALALIAGCVSGPSRPSSDGSGSHYKIGKPYKINGKLYRPAEDPSYDRTGVASWYGRDFHGKKTANGETFDMRQMTAAHTTLPLPSLVEVTNLENGRRTIVRVNDRGPFAHNRIIDLSRAAARTLGFEKDGLAKVRVKYLSRAPLPGEKPRTGNPPPTVAPVDPVAPRPAPGNTSDTDNIAALIAAADVDQTPSLKPPQPETKKAYVIQVAVLDTIDELPALRAALLNEGPLMIESMKAAESLTPAYRIVLGPFPNAETASARLEPIRKAGYSEAIVVARLAQYGANDTLDIIE